MSVDGRHLLIESCYAPGNSSLHAAAPRAGTDLAPVANPPLLSPLARHHLASRHGVSLASLTGNPSLLATELRRGKTAEDAVIVKITPNDKNNPPGKLADAELHFTDGALDGLKLIGFGVWERRTGGGRNVTFPARQYSVNGERRSFALLRPVGDATAQDRVRELILNSYAEYEENAAVAS